MDTTLVFLAGAACGAALVTLLGGTAVALGERRRRRTRKDQPLLGVVLPPERGVE